MHQQLWGIKGCPHLGGLLELFWDLGFSEVRPGTGVSNTTFPKIAGRGGCWWYLRLCPVSDQALWSELAHQATCDRSHVFVSPAQGQPDHDFVYFWRPCWEGASQGKDIIDWKPGSYSILLYIYFIVLY